MGALAVAAACLGWAVDNNLTQRVSGSDPVQVAGITGLAAGCVNLALAGAFGWQPGALLPVFAALTLGFLDYGVSLSLFVWALRHLGTARTGAYFSVAPFFGAASALIILAERPGTAFWLAAGMMVIGVWLHVTERHVHLHRHEHLVHTTSIGTMCTINMSMTSSGMAANRIPMLMSMRPWCSRIHTFLTHITGIAIEDQRVVRDFLRTEGSKLDLRLHKRQSPG